MLILGKRINILEYEYEDYHDMYDLLSDEKTAYFIGSKKIPDLDTAKLLMARKVISNEFYKIVLKDNTYIGDINFFKDSSRKNNNAYQIGFCLKKEFRRQGFMEEALKLFLSNIDLKNVDIISADVMVENEASYNLLKKLGFNLDGLRRHYKLMYDNKYKDIYEFSLLNDELRKEIKLWQKN